MKIQGLQKLTLLDYPGKVACTIFTAGCNFRCPFCHNASLVMHTEENEDITEEELFSFLQKRIGILDGVCISGGEPLLQADIKPFIEKVKALGYSVKLDTNGSFPKKLKSLVEDGLIDYVAMDVKNCKAHYGETIGVQEYDLTNIEESIAFLMQGKVSYEFRTTVVREFHKKKDFESIGEWIQGAAKYYLQSFVDSGDLIQTGLSGYEKKQMEEALKIVKKTIQTAELRGL